jgi:hypothetical protein
MTRDLLVRLPCSSRRNDANAFLTLLYRVRRKSYSAFDWEGKHLRPGRRVRELELRPEPYYPAIPILLECATSPLSVGKPGGGRLQRILWRYQPDSHGWEKLISAEIADNDASWVNKLAPIAIEALTQQGANRPAVMPNLAEIKKRLNAILDRELEPLDVEDRGPILTAIYETLAARIARTQPDFPGTTRPWG